MALIHEFAKRISNQQDKCSNSMNYAIQVIIDLNLSWWYVMA